MDGGGMEILCWVTGRDRDPSPHTLHRKKKRKERHFWREKTHAVYFVPVSDLGTVQWPVAVGRHPASVQSVRGRRGDVDAC